MKFVVDNMLKGLLRWLRFLGFDSIELESQSEKDSGANRLSGRYFLTASPKHFRNWSRDKKLLIPYDKIPDQLNYVNEQLSIFEKARFLSRCSKCNMELAPVKKTQIMEEIPGSVADRFEKFYLCPSCKRIYWEGGHVKRLIGKLETMGIQIK